MPLRLSRRLAGSLTKRKPRLASSRGSRRRSVTLSSEKRKPRSAQRRQALVLDRAGAAQAALREFEHQRGRDGAVGVEEFEQLREHRGVGQRRARKIAEHADLAVLEQQPAHHLHAAEHHQIVDLRHQAAGFGLGDEVGRQHHVAALGAQPRHRLVVAHLALRQRHDRLQIEVDAIGLDGAADGRQHLRAGALVGLPRRGGGVAATGRRSGRM